MSPRSAERYGCNTSNSPALPAWVCSTPNDRLHATLEPDTQHYPNLKHPPLFVDLDLDGGGFPELRIDRYVGEEKIISRFFSSNPAYDQFLLEADDAELKADGADATRIVFRVVDQYAYVRVFNGTARDQNVRWRLPNQSVPQPVTLWHREMPGRLSTQLRGWQFHTFRLW